MEEDSLSVLTVVVPAVVGASVVVVTVVLVFWLGAGRQTNYEDAMKARQGHAEKELRKIAAERERDQKQKREKKRPGRSGKRHEAGSGDVEGSPRRLPPPAQKGILKTATTMTSKAISVGKDKVRHRMCRVGVLAHTARGNAGWNTVPSNCLLREKPNVLCLSHHVVGCPC